MEDVERWEGEGGSLSSVRGRSAHDVAAGSLVTQKLRMLRILRRVAIGAAGGAVLAAGLALVVLPGPAILVIPLGVAILATEFGWARRLLVRVRQVVAHTVARARRRHRPA